jgi:hypothetical protein
VGIADAKAPARIALIDFPARKVSVTIAVLTGMRPTDALSLGGLLFLVAWRGTVPLTILLTVALRWVYIRFGRWGPGRSLALGALTSVIVVYFLFCVLVGFTGISM